MGLWSDPSIKGRDEAGKPLSDKRNPLPLGRGGRQMVHVQCTNIRIPDEKPIELVKFEARIAKLEALVNEMSRSGKSKRRK